ncbi:MAG: ERCC4 domain-containing protein [Candidatus Hodarchaeota archaeon]
MSEEHPEIIVDKREPEVILNEFKRLGVVVLKKNLSVADYVVSERIAIERKTGADFVSSIIDGRLFEQLERLTSTYKAPMLILEDPETSFQREGMKPSSIYGAMAYIVRNLQLPIVPSIDSAGTALFIYRLAYREQIEDKSPIQIRRAPKGMKLREKQIFLIEGLERTGSKAAERLLNEFHSPMGVFRAIKETEVLYTKTGNPKGIVGPLKIIKGLGHQYVERNRKILFHRSPTETAKKRPSNLSSLLPDHEEGS